VDGYDEWWSGAFEKYLDRPEFKILYELRRTVFHDGSLPTQKRMNITNMVVTPDSIRVNGQRISEPAGATRFIVSDRFGSDGWVLGSDDFVSSHVALPQGGTRVFIYANHPNFARVEGHIIVQQYLDALGALVDDAEQRFLA
tara:strand:+ start:676 stop:1101 length:426 start_codon:yes stop_codon:yes gene_type:complete